MSLEETIDALFDSGAPERTDENLALLAEFRQLLNKGEIRVAEPKPEDDTWIIHLWVKKGILLHSALGKLTDATPDGSGRHFELDTLPQRKFSAEDNVRVPPGGSFIRDGAYLGPGVICMPPVFVNLGAYVGAGTTLDSHVMVGLCAQIGERVQIGSGTQIGGYIDPPDRLPTVIGDEVVIGGNCGVYDGVHLQDGVMLAAGVILTAQSRIFDPAKEKYYCARKNQPLIVPPMAIIVMGARPMTSESAAKAALCVQVPIVAGYRDDPDLKDDLLRNLTE